MARSSATQAMTFECVKWRFGPRTSQMPWSGCRHSFSRKRMSASWSRQVSSLDSSPLTRATCIASITSPYTSSWSCREAALPMRTGAELS
jgi:hypothetical protein